MDKMLEARQTEFNRLLGCLGIIGAGLIAVALIIGYWATH